MSAYNYIDLANGHTDIINTAINRKLPSPQKIPPYSLPIILPLIGNYGSHSYHPTRTSYE